VRTGDKHGFGFKSGGFQLFDGFGLDLVLENFVLPDLDWIWT